MHAKAAEVEVNRKNAADAVNVGAAAGCDLLILILIFSRSLGSKIKRSQPRFARQLLRAGDAGDNPAGMPG
jgi:hypothetical protein